MIAHRTRYVGFNANKAALMGFFIPSSLLLLRLHYYNARQQRDISSFISSIDPSKADDVGNPWKGSP